MIYWNCKKLLYNINNVIKISLDLFLTNISKYEIIEIKLHAWIFYLLIIILKESNDINFLKNMYIYMYIYISHATIYVYI